MELAINAQLIGKAMQVQAGIHRPGFTPPTKSQSPPQKACSEHAQLPRHRRVSIKYDSRAP
jgi:hypothetical protein